VLRQAGTQRIVSGKRIPPGAAAVRARLLRRDAAQLQRQLCPRSLSSSRLGQPTWQTFVWPSGQRPA